MKEVLFFLKKINDDYSQLFLFVIALVTLIVIYKEYIAKRRPYIFPELVFEDKDNNWYFGFILKNTGSYPAQVKINKAQLKIGDEIYPSEFSSETLVPTGEAKKVLSVGHINKIGRDKVINGEYSLNRVEIYFEISSKSIGGKNYKYKTVVTYGIDIKGVLPVVQILSEKFS